MATANVVELEACIKDCLAYCEKNSELDFVKYFQPRLQRADRKFRDSVEVSDAQYRAWAQESISDKQAWKALGRQLKATQLYLGRVNAVGYPDKTVLHWDVDLLKAAVSGMLTWLGEHAEDVEDASDHIDQLERLVEIAEKERFQRDDALDDYARHAQFRSEAFGTLGATLGDFRKAMRRTLGKHDEGYRSIRWPFSLAPDRPVL